MSRTTRDACSFAPLEDDEPSPAELRGIQRRLADVRIQHLDVADAMGDPWAVRLLVESLAARGRWVEVERRARIAIEALELARPAWNPGLARALVGAHSEALRHVPLPRYQSVVPHVPSCYPDPHAGGSQPWPKTPGT